MFTGIVEGLAEVKSISKLKKKGADVGLRVRLGRLSKGLKTGDSVSVNGTCLTVTRLSKGEADFEMVAETVRRTNLGSVKPGDKVNIERSLRLGDRLEGHFVLGHVDGTGRVEKIVKMPSETIMWIKVEDRKLLEGLVPKGSVAIDGISLTLVEVVGDKMSVALIPHTLDMTTLGLRAEEDIVNIEIDVLSRYVANNLARNS